MEYGVTLTCPIVGLGLCFSGRCKIGSLKKTETIQVLKLRVLFSFLSSFSSGFSFSRCFAFMRAFVQLAVAKAHLGLACKYICIPSWRKLIASFPRDGKHTISVVCRTGEVFFWGWGGAFFLTMCRGLLLGLAETRPLLLLLGMSCTIAKPIFFLPSTTDNTHTHTHTHTYWD